MKSSQSNFDLRLPSSYLARSYLIATVNDLGLNVTNFIFVKKFKMTIPQCVWQYSSEPRLLSSSISAFDGFHHFVPSFIARNPNCLNFCQIHNLRIIFWTKLNKLLHSRSGSEELSHASIAHLLLLKYGFCKKLLLTKSIF